MTREQNERHMEPVTLGGLFEALYILANPMIDPSITPDTIAAMRDVVQRAADESGMTYQETVDYGWQLKRESLKSPLNATLSPEEKLTDYPSFD